MPNVPSYILELNKLFEHRPPTKAAIPPAEEPLEPIVVCNNIGATEKSHTPVSPASSSSTLELEDEEIKNIFVSDLYSNTYGSAFASPGNLAPILSSWHVVAIKDDPTLRPSDNLNPHAAPFVPGWQSETVVHSKDGGRHGSGYAHSQTTIHYPIAAPSWFPAFLGGINPNIFAEERSVHAHSLVASSLWTLEDIGFLAHSFCSRGSEGVADKDDPLAPFALMVHQTFWHLLGEEVARSFIWHLRETVIGTFLSRWDPEYPEPVSYKLAPTPGYVRTSLSLARFVGELFLHELINRQQIATCLSAVLRDLMSVEHLQVVCNVIYHSVPKLWHYPPGFGGFLDHFSQVFYQEASKLQESMSVLNEPLTPGQLASKFSAVLEMVSVWRSQQLVTTPP